MNYTLSTMFGIIFVEIMSKYKNKYKMNGYINMTIWEILLI